MKCLHCGQDLELPSRATTNVESYGQPVVTITLCCGKAVRLAPTKSFKVYAYAGKSSEDDWGFAIRKGD